MKRVLPAVVAVAGITLAQVHGGPFWVSWFASPFLGWSTSLTLETASVWLWWEWDPRLRYQFAKYGVTGVLLTGMIAHGVGPILSEREVTVVIGKGIAGAIQMERITLNKLLVAAVDQERRGWKDSIDDSRERLARLGAQSLSLVAASSSRLALPKWAVSPAAWLAAILFPLLYGLALLAVQTLSELSRTVPPKIPVEIRVDLESPELSPKKLVSRFARTHNLTTGVAVAEKLREHQSTLSEFANGKSGPEVTARIREKLEEVAE